MEGCMTKMFFAFFERLAYTSLFGNVTAQFFHVAFGLFCAFALQLGTLTFGFFRLRCCQPDVFEILMIGEVDYGNDGNRYHQRIHPDGVERPENYAGGRSPSDVANRCPQIMRLPGRPETG